MQERYSRRTFVRTLAAGAAVLGFNPDDDNLLLRGTVYPFSAVPLTADDWRSHYGRHWKALLTAKGRYDPDNVLASGPDVLGEGTD